MIDKKQPIIIKKVSHGEHGHHGGAWKVAFADFVTAMMAFFMLMWLMGSTTKEERAAISDYFNNPSMTPGSSSTPSPSGMQGPGGASTSMIDMGGAMDLTPGETMQNDSGEVENREQARKGFDVDVESDKSLEKERLESLLERLSEAVEKSEALKDFKDQLKMDITPEGLRIQIVDQENRPMFASGSAALQHYTTEILYEMARFINEVPNKISISGHTDATPFNRANYSNWELSADRANAARRTLIEGGMASGKVSRVVGLASSVLFNKEEPRHPVNRRISIIVLNKETEEAINREEGVTNYGMAERHDISLDDDPNPQHNFELKPLDVELVTEF